METKEYSNGEVTILWKADLCTHSGNCVRGLPEVFDLKSKPWINAKGASTEKIIDQVSKCPSGALSISKAKESNTEKTVDINLAKDGPLLVSGKIRIFDQDGNLHKEVEKCALCRCGSSNNKPFCDGTHKSSGFEG